MKGGGTQGKNEAGSQGRPAARPVSYGEPFGSAGGSAGCPAAGGSRGARMVLLFHFPAAPAPLFRRSSPRRPRSSCSFGRDHICCVLGTAASRVWAVLEASPSMKIIHCRLHPRAVNPLFPTEGPSPCPRCCCSHRVSLHCFFFPLFPSFSSSYAAAADCDTLRRPPPSPSPPNPPRRSCRDQEKVSRPSGASGFGQLGHCSTPEQAVAVAGISAPCSIRVTRIYVSK